MTKRERAALAAVLAHRYTALDQRNEASRNHAQSANAAAFDISMRVCDALQAVTPDFDRRAFLAACEVHVDIDGRCTS